ncbi:hypothetical protein OXX80_004684 [Metschnikowia pulcherrima]
MSGNNSSKVRYSKAELRSPDFELPSRERAPDAIKFKLFNWSLLPYEAGKERIIKLSCNMCVKSYKMKWPLNTTTLKNHVHNRHLNTIVRLQNEALESDDPMTGSILESSLVINSEPTPTLEDYRGVVSAPILADASLKASSRSRPVHAYFQINEYKQKVLRFIIANGLPFIVLDSPTFGDLVKYLKEDLPETVNRHTIKNDLYRLFYKEMRWLKRRIAENQSRFALTMDEWNSSNNYDFLAITLHFYNNSFELETYNIGFEYLNEFTSYTGETLFKILGETLEDYGLTNRIISITRDNAGPMNSCMSFFADSMSLKGVEFSGDVRCVGHVFNLAIEALLYYTFFRVKRTKKFEASLTEIAEMHPGLGDLALSMKTLPVTVRSIISGIRHNHFLKNSFAKLADKKKSARGVRCGPEVLVRDNETRWLSTFKMIDRFLYFKDEIKDLLRAASARSRSDDLDLECCDISEREWQYLGSLRDILAAFRGPTIKLQASSYSTINRTTPCVLRLLKDIEGHQSEDLESSNPYLAMGISKASEKILEYYPVWDESIEKMKDLFLATVLDPRYKLSFFRDVGLTNAQIDQIERYFYQVFDRYSEEYHKEADEEPEEIVPQKRRRETIDVDLSDDGEDYFLRRDEEAIEHEVDNYLKQPRADCRSPIEFYKDRKATYPIISRIAKDYLAMSAMSAPSESLFSQVGDMVTKKRNRLSPFTIKILALLKSRGKLPDETVLVDEASNVMEDSLAAMEAPLGTRAHQENGGIETERDTQSDVTAAP